MGRDRRTRDSVVTIRACNESHSESPNSRRDQWRGSVTLTPVVNRREKASNRRNDRGVVLDDVSKAIIAELQQDGRRPYAAIGKAVGLSEAAVRQRVQRLLDNGVMQIVAVTDPLEVGFPRQAMIGITVEGPLEPVADTLAEMDEIDYVVITAGGFDLLAEVVCESDEHLLGVLSNQIRTIPGVRRTESFVYLRLRKQTYAWGVR
jgi:Lrp/AsnC family transcriptional regulator for asnA, asnC and gidA